MIKVEKLAEPERIKPLIQVSKEGRIKTHTPPLSLTGIRIILSFLSNKEHEHLKLTCKKWKAFVSYFYRKLPIQDGYGDFLLIHKKGEVNKILFEKVFPYMNRYLPQVHQKPLENRLKMATEQIKQIDPDLELVFVPRTLYELYYILSAFKEELDLTLEKNYFGCVRQQKSQFGRGYKPPPKTCWHSYQFKEWTDKHNLDQEIVELAFKLNQAMIKELKPPAEGFTQKQWLQAGKALLDKFQKMDEEYQFYIRFRHISDYPCKAGEEDAVRKKIHLGIMIDPENLKKMITLECSERAKNALIFSRGSKYVKDPLHDKDQRPYSHSYGSLFSGYIHDINACAAGRIFYDKNTTQGFAVSISLKQKEWRDTFFVPPVTTLCALNGRGEDFHVRGKCLKPTARECTHLNYEYNSISGYSPIAGYYCRSYSTLSKETLDHLITPLDRTALSKQIDAYRKDSLVFHISSQKERGDCHISSLKL